MVVVHLEKVPETKPIGIKFLYLLVDNEADNCRPDTKLQNPCCRDRL